MAILLIDKIKSFVHKLIDSIAAVFKLNRTAPSLYSEEDLARFRVVRLLDYDQGIQIKYLLSILEGQFKRTYFLKLQPQIRNVVKAIADLVAMVFKNGVIISTDNENDALIYDQIMDDNKFDNFCRTLDRLVFLCKTVFVKISWRNEKICLDIITPEYVKLQSNDFDPYKIDEIIYPIKLNSKDLINPKGIFAYWDNETFYYVDQDGVILNNPDNIDNVNPYAIIPISCFREREPYSSNFFQWPGDELINAQDNINTKLTFRNYLIKRFSIPTPVLTGAKLLNGQNIIVDGSEVLNVETTPENPNGSFKWESSQVDIGKVSEAILDEFRTIMMLYGIDPSMFIASAQKSSGEAIKMSNAKLEERRLNAKSSYIYSLEELFDIIKIVWNTHSDNKLSDDPIRISIEDPRISYDNVSDKWLDYKNKIDNNVISVYDILMTERDDVSSQQEAQEIIDSNRLINKTISQISIDVLRTSSALGGQPTSISGHSTFISASG